MIASIILLLAASASAAPTFTPLNTSTSSTTATKPISTEINGGRVCDYSRHALFDNTASRQFETMYGLACSGANSTDGTTGHTNTTALSWELASILAPNGVVFDGDKHSLPGWQMTYVWDADNPAANGNWSFSIATAGHDGVHRDFDADECKDAFARIINTCLGRNFAGGRYWGDRAYFLQTHGYRGGDWGPPDVHVSDT